MKEYPERLIASHSYRAPCSPTASRLVGIMKAAAVLVGTPCIWMPPFGHHEDRRRRTATRQRARSRWRRSPKVGGESSADDKPSRRADSASCAGLGRRVHHSACRSGGHIRACRSSLVASRTTTGRAKRLPAIPILASAMQGARLHTTHYAQIGCPISGANRKTFTRSTLPLVNPKRTTEVEATRILPSLNNRTCQWRLR